MFEAILARIRRCNMSILKPFGALGSASLRCHLGDIDLAVSEALADAFGDVDAVEVVHGNLLDLSCDAIVSPANSFGDMGGGIDKAIDDFHEGEAQRRVMAAIADEYLGELPVGAGLVVEVGSGRFSFVVAAPTMRIPGSVEHTINAYLAMRAALVAVVKHNVSGGRRIGSLAIPGLGTGVGGIPRREAAMQMRTAYDNIIGGEWQNVAHPVQAPFALPSRSLRGKGG